jgi:hypothetical protein
MQFVIAPVEYCLRMLVYILLLDDPGKLHTTLTISSVCKHQDLERHFIAFFKLLFVKKLRLSKQKCCGPVYIQ